MKYNWSRISGPPQNFCMNEIQPVQNFWTTPEFLYERNTTGPEFLDHPRISVSMKFNWSRISGPPQNFCMNEIQLVQNSGPPQNFCMNEIQLVQNFWTTPEFLDHPRISVSMKYNCSRISGPAQNFCMNEMQLKHTVFRFSGKYTEFLYSHME